jgi:uroporphyrinogen-III synthase
MSFQGIGVLALESRRANEIAALIRGRQGDPTVAPSMREVPIERNQEAFDFAEKLFAGGFDMMILLTGVGTRYLHQVLSTRHPAERFPEALRSLTTVVRGPKPAAVLREMNVPISVQVPEPNTWRELLSATAGRPERRIALQEYGKPNPELIAGLEARGAAVTAVRVYQWDLPENTRPLREAVRRLARGDFGVIVFTTSVQVSHLFRIATEESLETPVRQALDNMVIASIGPTTSEMLLEYGLRADYEPTHPKMGFLIQETADHAAAILAEKQKKPPL